MVDGVLQRDPLRRRGTGSAASASPVTGCPGARALGRRDRRRADLFRGRPRRRAAATRGGAMVASDLLELLDCQGEGYSTVWEA